MSMNGNARSIGTPATCHGLWPRLRRVLKSMLESHHNMSLMVNIETGCWLQLEPKLSNIRVRVNPIVETPVPCAQPAVHKLIRRRQSSVILGIRHENAHVVLM